jgi:hypothetical protein
VFLNLNIYMKKLFPLFVLAIILIVACSQPSDNAQGADEKSPVKCEPAPPDTAYYAIDTAQAFQWVRAYQASNPQGVKFFTVEATDLWEAMALQEKPDHCAHYPKARIYMGLDSLGVTHLLFTPADENGQPVFLAGTYKKGSRAFQSTAELTTSSGQYVLDFSSPCPTTCP